MRQVVTGTDNVYALAKKYNIKTAFGTDVLFSRALAQRQGAMLADLLLVEGNPLENIKLVADPAKNFLVIMKDGTVYKNTLAGAEKK